MRAISAACICCSTNSKFCTPRSCFVEVGRNSRLMSSVVISSLFSCPPQHHLGLLDHSSEECLRLLRTLLEILFLVSEFLRTTKAIHINETRSGFPKLSCGKIVDCPYCCCQSRLCSNYELEDLLKLCDNLLHRRRRRSRSVSAPPAFHVSTYRRKLDQSLSSNHLPEDFSVHQTRSQGQLPPRNNNTPRAQTITMSANHRYATMMN